MKKNLLTLLANSDTKSTAPVTRPRRAGKHHGKNPGAFGGKNRHARK